MQDFLCLNSGGLANPPVAANTNTTTDSAHSSPATARAISLTETVNIVVELPDENKMTVSLTETARTPDLLDVCLHVRILVCIMFISLIVSMTSCCCCCCFTCIHNWYCRFLS